MLRNLQRIILLILIWPSFIYGQYQLFSDFGKSAFVDVKTHIGKPIEYSDSLSTSLQNSFFALDYRFGINSFGRMPQDRKLNWPNYGIGFTHYQMNSDSIGNPLGLYGFFSSPFFINNTKLKIGFELSAGFSFNFNEFNLVINPKNDLIGSKLNVYFNLSIIGRYLLTERLDLISSVDFTHFSNGTMNTPNKGLNLYGGNLGLRYHFQFQEKKSAFERIKEGSEQIAPLDPHYEWTIWGALGAKTILTPTYDGPIYFCSTISSDINRRYAWIGRYGAGIDFFYDHSLSHNKPNQHAASTKYLFIGIHGNHEFIVGDFSLSLQIGTYVWRKLPSKGNFYIRTGLKYDLSKKLFLNLSLKSQNGFKADYIEAGMGYRLGKKESIP